jgi:general stress protein 26
MTNDTNREFLGTKLQQIRNAVMHTHSNNGMKFHNDIVSFVKMDEQGQLWFKAHAPKYNVAEYETRFPVKLFFYQKGVNFYIETSGTASIAGHEDVLEHESELEQGMLLLKMVPFFVEYTETGRKQPVSWANKVYSQVVHWFTDRVKHYHANQLSQLEKI